MRFRGRGRRGDGAALPPLPSPAGDSSPAPSAGTRVPAAQAQRGAFQFPELTPEPRGPLRSARRFEDAPAEAPRRPVRLEEPARRRVLRSGERGLLRGPGGVGRPSLPQLQVRRLRGLAPARGAPSRPLTFFVPSLSTSLVPAWRRGSCVKIALRGQVNGP